MGKGVLGLHSPLFPLDSQQGKIQRSRMAAYHSFTACCLNYACIVFQHTSKDDLVQSCVDALHGLYGCMSWVYSPWFLLKSQVSTFRVPLLPVWYRAPPPCKRTGSTALVPP